jgi:hypothetical protein
MVPVYMEECQEVWLFCAAVPLPFCIGVIAKFGYTWTESFKLGNNVILISLKFTIPKRKFLRTIILWGKSSFLLSKYDNSYPPLSFFVPSLFYMRFTL